MREKGDVIDEIAEVVFDFIPEKVRNIRDKVRGLLTGKKAEKPVSQNEYFFQKEMAFDNRVWNLIDRGRNVGGLSFYLEEESGNLIISFNNAVHSHPTVQEEVKWPLESRSTQLTFDSGSVQLKLRIVSREDGAIMLFANALVTESSKTK